MLMKSAQLTVLLLRVFLLRRSRWPRGLRHESTAARFLGLWVRIPQRGHGCRFFVNVVCCQVEVSAMGRPLVQRGPTECGVSECDREASEVLRPWPTGGCRAMKKKNATCFRYVLAIIRRKFVLHMQYQISQL
jgi:hypothetical protein